MYGRWDGERAFWPGGVTSSFKDTLCTWEARVVVFPTVALLCSCGCLPTPGLREHLPGLLCVSIALLLEDHKRLPSLGL